MDVMQDINQAESRGLFKYIFLVMTTMLVAACGGTESVGTTVANNSDVELSSDQSRSHIPQATSLVKEGERLLAAEDAASARLRFEEALRENSNDARAHLDLGIAMEMLGDIQSAEKEYRAAISNQEDFAEALNNLGVLLRDKGELKESIFVLKKAVSANPRSASAHMNLALAFEDGADLKGAESQYNAALKLKPQDVLTRTNLGLLMIKMGRTDSAAEQLKKALDAAAGNRPALVAIGNGLRRVGEAQASLKAMVAAIKSGDGKPTAALLAELALSQRANGDRESALASLSLAIELEKDFAISYYLMANMLAGSGEYKKAIEYYKKYLDLAPDGPQADQAKERMKRARQAVP